MTAKSGALQQRFLNGRVWDMDLAAFKGSSFIVAQCNSNVYRFILRFSDQNGVYLR